MKDFALFCWEDGWPGRVILALTVLTVAITALVLAVGAHSVWLDYAHPCIRSHKEWVRHPGWMQHMRVNNQTILIWHPAREGWEDVCDERS